MTQTMIQTVVFMAVHVITLLFPYMVSVRHNRTITIIMEDKDSCLGKFYMSETCVSETCTSGVSALGC